MKMKIDKNMRDLIKTSIIAIVAFLIGGQTINAETKRALLVGISDYVTQWKTLTSGPTSVEQMMFCFFHHYSVNTDIL